MDARAAHPFLHSEDAEMLRDVVSHIAPKWLLNDDRRDGLKALAEAVLYAAEEAIVPALRLWNARNDRMGRLPVELRLHCFSYLPTAALLTASSACVAWNNLISGTPDLWTNLDMITGPVPAPHPLQRALRLSRGRPLAISARITNQVKLYVLYDQLVQVWRRLRGLHIDQGQFQLPEDYPSTLLTPAPELQSFTYLCSNPLPSGTLLFGGNAPKLRSVRVSNWLCLVQESGLPAQCPALRGVTTLALRANRPVPHDFFEILPNLRTLDILNIPSNINEPGPFCLPHLPRRHPLARLQLKRYMLGTARALRNLGFMRVPHLSVEGHSIDVVIEALAAPGSLSLRAEVSDQLLLSVTPDTPHPASGVFFSTEGFPSRELYALFRAPLSEDIFNSVTALTLPRDFSPRNVFAADDRFNNVMHSSLFPVAPLPRLRTLTILCGPRAGDSLLATHVLQQCGILLAPVLERLVLMRMHPACRNADPVCPLDLMLFVSLHLSIERPAGLEVVVDRDLGFVERGDGGAAIEVLESHVGSLVVRPV